MFDDVHDGDGELLNREPPVEDLISSFITTTGGYDRNHGSVPHIEGEEHIVHVDGAVKKNLNLSMAQLSCQFRQHKVVCALSCAGNRRHTMRTLVKEVQGIDWGDGAVMNCEWKGPLLRDILTEAGLDIPDSDFDKGHVAFACYQTVCQQDSWYGSSIELRRAMREEAEIILALEMNGQSLPRNHGYPVRIIAPGLSGCRSVKWLDRITVQMQESCNFYQLRDYKILPPEAVDDESAAKFWSITPAFQESPINSVIAVPKSGDTVLLSSEGTVDVRGYALPQGDQGPVTKVEVSTDNGKTWADAEILDCAKDQSKWSWVLWKARVLLKEGKGASIHSRATDRGGNTQHPGPQWNLRGIGYNGFGIAMDLTVTLTEP